MTNEYLTYQQRNQHWKMVDWLKQRGITSADLDAHPCIDDIILLIRIRDEFWTLMTMSEQATWGAQWGYTYGKRQFIRPRTLAKFEHIVLTVNNREQLKTEQRQLIKALRNEQLKRSHNSEAKGLRSHSLDTRTVNNECAVDCPYF